MALHATNVLRAAALGAVAMYLLDPDNGRRRRAIARDKAQSLVQNASEVVAAAGRDVANRARGARAATRRALYAPTVADDLQLIERVRARIGRVVSHPHAIQVGAQDGWVTLSGPILADEVSGLIRAASNVPGVRGVSEHLDVHREPGSVPSLQGEGRRRGNGNGNGYRGPEMRAAQVLGGGAMVLAGLARGSLTGAAIAAIGAALAARGAGTRLLPSPPSERANAAQLPVVLPEDQAPRSIDAPA
jgi:hypothetical protein